MRILKKKVSLTMSRSYEEDPDGDERGGQHRSSLQDVLEAKTVIKKTSFYDLCR